MEKAACFLFLTYSHHYMVVNSRMTLNSTSPSQNLVKNKCDSTRKKRIVPCIRCRDKKAKVSVSYAASTDSNPYVLVCDAEW